MVGRITFGFQFEPQPFLNLKRSVALTSLPGFSIAGDVIAQCKKREFWERNAAVYGSSTKQFSQL